METKIALDYVLVIFLLLSSITLTRERGMLEIERIPSHNQVQFLSPYCGLIELARLFFYRTDEVVIGVFVSKHVACFIYSKNYT